jgi:hypothetical protein
MNKKIPVFKINDQKIDNFYVYMNHKKLVTLLYIDVLKRVIIHKTLQH